MRYRLTYRDPRIPEAPWHDVYVQAPSAMEAAQTLENISLEVMHIVLVSEPQAS